MSNDLAPVKHELRTLLANPKVKQRFEEILGRKAAGFMSSLMSVQSSNELLKKADAQSIIAAGAVAASLDLPVIPSLGFAYIVPYRDKAQFQLGWRGLIQLAMRTGQYKTINTTEVYDGEIANINKFTGEIEFGTRKSDKVVGYLAYFKLINSFEKYLYMSVDEVERHAKKYSQTYQRGFGKWKDDFHNMALKTVLKLLISKFGILSIEFQGSLGVALQADQAVVKEDEFTGEISYEYVDNTIELGPEEAKITEPSATEKAFKSRAVSGMAKE